MTQHQIVTSPGLIKLLGEKLYNNRLDVILVRELIQNAVDASRGTGNLVNVAVQPKDVYIDWRDQICYRSLDVAVDDSGVGMSKKILTDVFLSIGSSFKPGEEETTGGFGIAKVALFSADKWSVNISGGTMNHDLKYRKASKRKGVRVQASMNFESGNQAYENRMWCMIYGNDVPNLRVNGTDVKPFKATGRINRYSTNSGIPFTIRTAPELYMPVSEFYPEVDLDEDEPDPRPNDRLVNGAIFFRINGLVQYVSPSGVDGLTDAKRNLIVDFENIGYKPVDSSYPFSMSRESCDWGVVEKVSTITAKFAKDTLSMVKKEETESEPIWYRNPRTGLWSQSVDGKRYNPDQIDRDVVKLWGEMIKGLMGWTDVNVEFCVTNDPDVEAFRVRGSEVPDCEVPRIYGINPRNFISRAAQTIAGDDTVATLVQMWHWAIHEIAHEYQSGHDEKFAAMEGCMASETAVRFGAIFGELRFLTRKVIRRLEKEGYWDVK